MTNKMKTIPVQTMRDFVESHRLPHEFHHVAEQHYLPLVTRLPDYRSGSLPLYLGINGAQGTGKSTLADFIRIAATSMLGWNVAVMSIDDFYFTLEERQALADSEHPLLITRGVPGTHDTDMLAFLLDRLRELSQGESILLPRFDKAIDDRADESQWASIEGPIDLIILEGWCVGSVAQPSDALQIPINHLEHEEDSDGTWRNYVNDRLEQEYRPIFDRLNALFFLRAPSFDAILRWRTEQEEKLATVSPKGSTGLMGREQIKRFLQYYERITRANLEQLPNSADIVFNLDEAHSIQSAIERDKLEPG